MPRRANCSCDRSPSTAPASAVWEWNARRDEIKVSPVIEASSASAPGELSTKIDDFTKHLHPADRERFQLMLVVDAGAHRGRRSAPISACATPTTPTAGSSSRPPACPTRTARPALRRPHPRRDGRQARARAAAARRRARQPHGTAQPRADARPPGRRGDARQAEGPGASEHLLFIDIDKFKSVNVSFGLVVGDSLLLTVARRLQTHLGPQDTLARVGGDQFAVAAAQPSKARRSWPRSPSACAARCARRSRSPARRSC